MAKKVWLKCQTKKRRQIEEPGTYPTKKAKAVVMIVCVCQQKSKTNKDRLTALKK